MQYSTNFNLKLFDGTDEIKRQNFVDNFTTIDTQMKNIDNKHSAYGITSGTNSYTVTIAGITSYYDGLKITIKIGTSCTGASSLNVNNLGTKTILDGSGNAIASGGLKAGIPYSLCYNGTNFILLSKGTGGGGTATSDKLLIGYTASTDSGLISGSMPNLGAVTSTINCSGTYSIPAGYHNGNGKITANSLAAQTSANAGTGSLLAGHTAWVMGNKLTGTIPDKSTESIGGADSNSFSTSSSLCTGTAYNSAVGAFDIKFPLGYHNGSNSARIHIPNLLPNNIVSGVKVGWEGNYILGSATVSSMGGTSVITGTTYVVNSKLDFKDNGGTTKATNYYEIPINGGFTPKSGYVCTGTGYTSTYFFTLDNGDIWIITIISSNSWYIYKAQNNTNIVISDTLVRIPSDYSLSKEKIYKFYS